MRKFWLLGLIVALALVGTVACQPREEAVEEQMEMEGETTMAIPGEEEVGAMEAEMALDDFTLGTEVGPDGAVASGATTENFTVGQTVYYAIETGDAEPGSVVRVVWMGPDGSAINEESKTVGGTGGEQYVNFQADTTGWASGDYKVQAWMGDEMVNEESFNVGEEGTEAQY